jgi:hypothetical protein
VNCQQPTDACPGGQNGEERREGGRAENGRSVNGALCSSYAHEAKARGWTVVDMKADWKKIYPFE